MRRRTSARGYGTLHQNVRAKWAVLVRAGGVACARCGREIEPTEPWDLGHDDHDRTRYQGPEHRKCNRQTKTHRKRATANLQTFEDKPELGIFWGPPEEGGGPPRRWSRKWFEWRDEGVDPVLP
jgi:hypothetical protein